MILIFIVAVILYIELLVPAVTACITNNPDTTGLHAVTGGLYWLLAAALAYYIFKLIKRTHNV